MARKLREKSGTGIYHVMLRGVNRMNIFEDSRDYYKFRDILRQQVWPVDELGRPLPSRCIVYAYCLMTNHVHLLIREGGEGLSDVMKRISVTYALYYNNKYEHVGHLFQNRYRSEPVNDNGYFFTLLRYIHQNPVAAGLSTDAGSYPWSSWQEYLKTKVGIEPVICTVKHVLQHMSLDELSELVNTPLPKMDGILECEETVLVRSDDEVSSFMVNTFGLRAPMDVQRITKERRNDILRSTRLFGAGIRQLARLTGIGVGVIRNL